MSIAQSRVRQWRTVVKNSQEANPNVFIELINIPGGDYNSKLLAMIASGTPPDVININSFLTLELDGMLVEHPGWLRCSSLTYDRYARSSRLASRAPRRSRCDAGFHHGLLGARRIATGS